MTLSNRFNPNCECCASYDPTCCWPIVPNGDGSTDVYTVTASGFVDCGVPACFNKTYTCSYVGNFGGGGCDAIPPDLGKQLLYESGWEVCGEAGITHSKAVVLLEQNPEASSRLSVQLEYSTNGGITSAGGAILWRWNYCCTDSTATPCGSPSVVSSLGACTGSPMVTVTK